MADCFGVIAPVAQYAIRTMARSSPLSLQRWYGINQCEGLLRVVTIGSGQLNRQQNSTTIANQMPLAAELRSVGGIRSRLRPTKTARTELPSTTTRDQSIFPKRASQSNKTKWISCQMPASCQSRNRRQQLIPEPQERSGRRGLPPLSWTPGLVETVRSDSTRRREEEAWPWKLRSSNSDVPSYHAESGRIGLVTPSKDAS